MHDTASYFFIQWWKNTFCFLFSLQKEKINFQALHMQTLKYLFSLLFPPTLKRKENYNFLISCIQLQASNPNPELNYISTSCKKLLITNLGMIFNRILCAYQH